MAKPEWGIKRACLSCGARFYDLKRDPIICPKCEAVFDPLATLRSRRTRTAAVVAPAKPVAPKPVETVAEDTDAAADDDEVLAVINDDDDDDDVIEDASELGEDDDDVSDVPAKSDDD